MATRRNSPSRIDSSRLLCTLRMYQSILSDFGSSTGVAQRRVRRLSGGGLIGGAGAAGGRGGRPAAAVRPRRNSTRRAVRSSRGTWDRRRLFGRRRTASGAKRPAGGEGWIGRRRGSLRGRSSRPGGAAAAPPRPDSLAAAIRQRLAFGHVQFIHHGTIPKSPTPISRTGAPSKTNRSRPGQTPHENQDQHHHRGAKQFAPRGPRHLVHLRFHGDEEIGEGGNVDQAVRAQTPRASSQQRQAELVLRRWPTMIDAQPHQAQREDPRHRSKGDLPA